jgi:hypothetical protein
MPNAEVDHDFVFKVAAADNLVLPTTDPLQQLIGTWQGKGFNAIWVPLSSGGGHRLLLAVIDETLAFSRIPGVIPNRGLQQGDIGMTGVTYIDQIADENGNGLHMEPGIWAVVPATTNPTVPQSIVRMGSIPHGSTIVAQGTFGPPDSGPPPIPNNNIIPIPPGGPAPPPAQAVQTFPELNISGGSSTLVTTPSVTQAMVDNPNRLLQALETDVTGYTTITISTADSPLVPGFGNAIPGGGAANTAFLGDATPSPGNARVIEVDATFWIETIPNAAGGSSLQLQYTQTVLLAFDGQQWPHVTVATLQQTSQGPYPIIAQGG